MNKTVRIIIFHSILLLFVGLSGCTKNNQIPVSPERFTEAARELGYGILFPGVNDTFREAGITEYCIAGKDAEYSPYHIHFHYFNDSRQARHMFDVMLEFFRDEIPYTVNFGTTNSSGLFGNSQDYYIANANQVRRLIRVENTFVYSVSNRSSHDADVRLLYDAIGYKFTIDR